MFEYNENNLVSIAKRENNKKRNYLVVNRLQGKHVPVKPSIAINMFDELCKEIVDKYENEKLLLIGFAETATAIGASIACKINCTYMQTTREIIDNVEYLFFTEAHSHATQQKLVKDDLDNIIHDIDRIIFIEDEVTTGNTIKNIIDIIKKTYEHKISVKFSIASILNGMQNDILNKFNQEEIECLYLVKTDHSLYEKKAEMYKGNGIYYDMINKDIGYECIELQFKGLMDARRSVDSLKYKNSCNEFASNIINYLQIKNKNILVLGTEEFMYPALYAAKKLEDENNNVLYHATTRSPIVVSNEKDYPLHSRFHLMSMYDCRRKIYIYNLKKYDYVIIITDAQCKDKIGTKNLIAALRNRGNKNIYLIRWCK